MPAGVVPPSGDSYFTICLTESTQKHPDASHPSPDARAHSRTQVSARWMTGGSSRRNPPPPISSRPHTDSSRHLRQLPLSQRKDSDPQTTSGRNQQLKSSARRKPTPPPPHPNRSFRINAAALERGDFLYLVPRQGRDFIRLSPHWLMVVSIMALKLKDRPWWNLRGTEMTDGGRGPEHG